MLTEEGLCALTTEIVTPHPPASAGTFSQWEKEARSRRENKSRGLLLHLLCGVHQ